MGTIAVVNAELTFGEQVEPKELKGAIAQERVYLLRSPVDKKNSTLRGYDPISSSSTEGVDEGGKGTESRREGQEDDVREA